MIVYYGDAPDFWDLLDAPRVRDLCHQFVISDMGTEEFEQRLDAFIRMLKLVGLAQARASGVFMSSA